MKGFVRIFLVVSFALCFLGTAAQAADSVWDGQQQLLLVRGIGVMGGNDPNNYYAVMKLVDTSQGKLIFEVKEVGLDGEGGDAVYYPADNTLNFYLPLDDQQYDIWMKLVQGDSGTLYAILTSME